jgi:hypothetical protein
MILRPSNSDIDGNLRRRILHVSAGVDRATCDRRLSSRGGRKAKTP